MCLTLVSDPTPLKKGQQQQLERAWIDWYVQRQISEMRQPIDDGFFRSLLYLQMVND